MGPQIGLIITIHKNGESIARGLATHATSASTSPEIAEQKHQQAAATACAAISIQGAMECHSTGVSTKPGCLNKETEERQEHEEESNISIHLGLDTHNTSCETK